MDEQEGESPGEGRGSAAIDRIIAAQSRRIAAKGGEAAVIGLSGRHPRDIKKIHRQSSGKIEK
ncbi:MULTISPECIES: hypothetical protein [Eisenbergiella]|jgi:hypothetical protein|uniref:hypothetical protein n=1 Tax=Eisenbergiella TaxID=1432051 RepID=UPI0011C14BFA|nr:MULTISPECIES: hypothetical protein [Eisenbergiella]